MAINWNKPVEVKRKNMVGGEVWAPCKFLGIVEYGDRAKRKWNRAVNTTNGVFYYDVLGVWEYALNSEECCLRNTPEKKRYTIVTVRQKAGNISSHTLAGSGLPNMEIGKTYWDSPIIHVTEFELAA
jgi:hypothetical protein